MEDKTFLAVVTMSLLTLLESIAMITQNDGAFFLPVVGLIGAAAGSVLGFKYGETKTLEKIGGK